MNRLYSLVCSGWPDGLPLPTPESKGFVKMTTPNNVMKNKLSLTFMQTLRGYVCTDSLVCRAGCMDGIPIEGFW